MKYIFILLILFFGKDITYAQNFSVTEVFGPDSTFSTIATGKIDTLDNYTDVVAATEEGDVYVFKGQGDYEPIFQTGLYLGVDPKGLTLVDLNDDGNLDLLYAFDSTLNFLAGNHSFGFSFEWSGGVPGLVDDISVADVDDDGDIDIITSTFSSGKIYVNYGPDYVTQYDYDVPFSGYNQVEVGKMVSSIAAPSLFFMPGTSMTTAIYEYQIDGNRDITYVTSYVADSLAVYQNMNGMCIVDYNHDGIQDLCAVSGANMNSARLYRWQHGTSDPEIIDTILDIPAAPTAGDFDNDGEDEIAILHSGQNLMSLVDDSDIESFSVSATEIPHSGSMSVTDINNDGFDDLLYPGRWSQIVVNANNHPELSLDESKVERLHIYPNPCMSHIYVNTSASKITYELYSSSGVLVKNGTVDGNGYIDCRNIQAGFYILHSNGVSYSLIKK